MTDDGQKQIEPPPERRGWAIWDFSWLRRPPELFVGLAYAVVIMLGVAAAASTLWMFGRTVAAIFDGGRTADDINKLLLGLAGLVGAPFVIWRVTIAARANRIAAETAQENSRIAQENLYTTLLTRAVEQLGATREEKVSAKGEDGKMETEIKTVPNTEVRLGAIYALERLARDYEPLHWPIMEILCAYVRKNCGPPPPEMSEEVRAAYGARLGNDAAFRQIDRRETALRAPYVDVQAALTVIGRRGADRRALEQDLRATSANPDAYRLDFTGAALMKARLEGLHFEEALFDGACLEGARLNRAYLEGARLYGAHLEGAVLYDAHLEGARVNWARLEGARLDVAHLEGAGLYEAHLEGAWLNSAHLEGAGLYEAHLKGAWLVGAHLEGARLDDAHLEGSALDGAHLEGASLDAAQLAGANLDGALLDDVMFDGADLSAAKGLSSSRLSAAWGDRATALPPGMERPTNERWLAARTNEVPGPNAREARFKAWSARRDHWLGEARKRREAEVAARRNPLPEGEGRPGGPG
jgi:uncharacterized protein YjbI with pentapeptide repeats